MKVKLQDAVKECVNKNCWNCKYGDDRCRCNVTIGGFIPSAYIEFVNLCKNYPEQAKALFTNEEFDI